MCKGWQEGAGSRELRVGKKIRKNWKNWKISWKFRGKLSWKLGN
jgi:hypothetical protein